MITLELEVLKRYFEIKTEIKNFIPLVNRFILWIAINTLLLILYYCVQGLIIPYPNQWPLYMSFLQEKIVCESVVFVQNK